MNILFNFRNLFVLSLLLIVIGLSFKEDTFILVEVKGEVKAPGVYKVSDEKVVNDILELAILLPTSDTSQLNLSKKVYDEMVIIVPSKEEIANMKVTTSYKVIENECVCPRLINDSCISLTIPNDEIIINTKVSLNNGTLEELMTLPGIGEAKAKAIIEYRHQHKFQTIEEIMNVKGIGKSIYEKLKDLISL